MNLDRDINPDGRGKYALVKLRGSAATFGEIRGALDTVGVEVDFGDRPETDFFVIRLKDKYAAPALAAYALAAFPDDPEYGLAVLNLAKKASENPAKRAPD